MDDIEPPQTLLRPRRQLANSRRVLERVQVRLGGVHAGWPFMNGPAWLSVGL